MLRMIQKLKSMQFLATFIFAYSLFIAATTAPAHAQAMREVFELPADCTFAVTSQLQGSPDDWKFTARLEHCDRIKRLTRLSETLAPDQRPRFYEGVVPASRLPSAFGVDLPVLRVVFPERTFFDTGKSNLRPEARRIAALVSESLRKEPADVAMFVAGHADIRGSDDQNEALSINRADAVARDIFQRGVNSTSIWRIGFGEDMPLFGGNTDADFALNRRVEFLFSAKPEVVAVWLADQQFGELCQSRSDVDSNACKSGLKFRDDYEAEKVDLNPHKPTFVRRGSSKSVRYTPNRELPTRANPTAVARVQAIPSGTRKIRIDPVNPRSNPVRVTL